MKRMRRRQEPAGAGDGFLVQLCVVYSMHVFNMCLCYCNLEATTALSCGSGRLQTRCAGVF